MYYILKFTSNAILNIIVKFINIFIKRDKDIWLFGSWMGEKFSDNSRFLYQYAHKNATNIGLKKIIWITRNKDQIEELNGLGYKAVYIKSFSSIYYHLKSGVHFVCNVPHNTKKYKGDILGELSLGAVRIQLWHGIPIKGVGNTKKSSEKLSLLRQVSSKLKNSYLYKHYVNKPGGWDQFYLLSTSREVSRRFKNIFMIDQEYIFESSYPRNCDCIELLKSEQNVIDRLSDYDKVFLYLPTFREGSNNVIQPLSDNDFVKKLKFYNVLWIQKPHTAEKDKLSATELDENIINLDSTFDINVLMKHIDVLITDYSSVSFDAIYNKKHIIYYTPDFNEYIKLGLSASFEENTVGEQVFSLEELSNAVDSLYDNNFKFDKSLDANKIVFDLVYDGENAKYENIIKDILNQIGG